MTTSVTSSYTNEQIVSWLRGLMTIAWADGHFDPEERELISQITHDELSLDKQIDNLEKISPEELATAFGSDSQMAENFLRTAVMVAIADGVYSPPEAELLQKFSKALGLDIEALKSLEATLYHEEETDSNSAGAAASPLKRPEGADGGSPKILQPVQEWLDGMNIDDPRVAKFICKIVPSQCPFERDINLFGRKIAHIPPMCKLNPLYEQLVGLRFRSLSYLADDCGEDVTPYI
ncbi:MAG: nitrogenase [Okeania sp. SIO2D1]|nr:nitrogenase [Okeania sp. SIO2D1]